MASTCTCLLDLVLVLVLDIVLAPALGFVVDIGVGVLVPVGCRVGREIPILIHDVLPFLSSCPVETVFETGQIFDTSAESRIGVVVCNCSSTLPRWTLRAASCCSQAGAFVCRDGRVPGQFAPIRLVSDAQPMASYCDPPDRAV
jgi:hypothetical protein